MLENIKILYKIDKNRYIPNFWTKHGFFLLTVGIPGFAQTNPTRPTETHVFLRFNGSSDGHACRTQGASSLALTTEPPYSG